MITVQSIIKTENSVSGSEVENRMGIIVLLNKFNEFIFLRKSKKSSCNNDKKKLQKKKKNRNNKKK